MVHIEVRANYDPTRDEHDREHIILVPSDWNDWWKFKNLYAAWYRPCSADSMKIVELGPVKIEDPTNDGQDNPTHPLPVGYSADKVDDNLISLGQTDEYYQMLSELPEFERNTVCTAMRDAVADSTLLQANADKNAVRSSLLRYISLSTVQGEYRRILRHEGDANYFRLKYCKGSFETEFIVDPKLKPRTNLHVVIGRNGVGKTTLLRSITRLLATGDESDPDESLSVLDEDGNSEGILSGVSYVSWSAFDSLDVQDWNLSEGIFYSQIGVNGIRHSTPEGKLVVPEVVEFGPTVSEDHHQDSSVADETPTGSFVRAFSLVIERRRGQLWRETTQALESDPVFRELNILKQLNDILDPPRTPTGEPGQRGIDRSTVEKAFDSLSDGHKVVLLTITYIAATLAEQTLVVLDEPEAHLHPPLLASLIRCLNDLLVKKNAMAIVVTHSPVVLQEVPKTNAKKLSRNSKGLQTSLPEIETFGEDVSSLTQDVFGLEVSDSGFYSVLRDLASDFDDPQDAINELDRHIGVLGRSVLRSLIAAKHRKTAESDQGLI